jgi:hypothetical protein
LSPPRGLALNRLQLRFEARTSDDRSGGQSVNGSGDVELSLNG